MRFAYADPPYPGKAFYYVERAEVDHAALIRRLVAEYPDGWALSTSAVALAGVLRLCPPSVRVLAWVKRPRGGSGWEPVIVAGGRRRSTGDASRPTSARPLDVLIYKGRYNAFPGALVGMKPPQFSAWLFRHLGALPGDSLDDLFPGSGAVSLAWRRFVALDQRDASRRDLGATAREIHGCHGGLGATLPARGPMPEPAELRAAAATDAPYSP